MRSAPHVCACIVESNRRAWQSLAANRAHMLFVRGIATFVKAAAQWSAENPASSILWMETAPQHFGEPNDDPVGDSKYGYTNGVRCGRLPRVPIPVVGPRRCLSHCLLGTSQSHAAAV